MDEREVSPSELEEQGEFLVESVQQAVDEWVEVDEIPVRRSEDEIVADEEKLIENISVMIAIAVSEFSG